MKLSKDARRLSRQLFRDSFSDGRLDEIKIRQAVRSVGEAKPRQFMNVLKDYQRLIRLEIEKSHAVVESPAVLPLDTAFKIERDLKTRFGQDLTTEFKLNPQLIAGLRIKIGNDVWDGTVRSRLDRLTDQFTHA